MRRFVLLLPFVLACSSAAPQDFSDAGPPKNDGGGSDAKTALDASASDAGDPTTDAGDGGLDPLASNPPAGSKKCGSGVISGASSASACMEPAMVLDDVPQPDGGTASMPRACNALSIGGGEWQVWCTANEAYVWARFDSVGNAGTLTDCHGSSLIMIDEGLEDSGWGGGNDVHVATYEKDGTQISGTTPGDSQTMIASVTLPSETSGSAQLFVAGMLEDTCSQGGFDPPVVLAGLDVTWTP